jgi:hypothetical protein
MLPITKGKKIELWVTQQLINISQSVTMPRALAVARMGAERHS